MILGILLMLAVPAAAVVREPASAGQPQRGLIIIPLTIASAGGGMHHFRIEYAGSEAQQATGMMFRPHVPRGTGMIFPHTPPRAASFWMRNTVSSLDLIFISPGGTIESIAARAAPLSDTVIASKAPVEAVLEIGPGESARLGINPGDRVLWHPPLAEHAPIR